MKKEITFEQLVVKVQQQEDTVVQLLKIIAATNHRITELQMLHERNKVKGDKDASN